MEMAEGEEPGRRPDCRRGRAERRRHQRARARPERNLLRERSLIGE